ncbi:MAG: hypothetical protein ACI8X5_003250 [Planctomycetota bacterium]|jgi:hypothetical protein
MTSPLISQPNLEATEIAAASKTGAQRTCQMPLGAVQLDTNGKVQQHMLFGEYLKTPGGATMEGTNFFEEFFSRGLLENLSELYREGVKAGELYYFVDFTVKSTDGIQHLCLLLYFHSNTQRGWAFIENQNVAVVSERSELRRAA